MSNVPATCSSTAIRRTRRSRPSSRCSRTRETPLLTGALAREGDFNRAIVGFRRAWALDPTHRTAAYNIGTILLHKEEPVDAARWLETALISRPEHVPTYNNLGKAYFLAGLPELAVASYEEALRRDPANRVALANLATLHGASSRPTSAATYRRQLEALGRDVAAPPPAPDATRSGATHESAPQPGGEGEPPAADLSELRDLLSALPHVRVSLRAGGPTVTGWTRNATERAHLDRVLRERESVLDLTTDDTGDSQRMIEVDATIFVVSTTNTESHGFNFLELVTVTADIFAADNLRNGAGLIAPGTYGGGAADYQTGWFTSASVDYDVTIANAVDERVAILARPHLTTLSGTPATFLAGGEFVFRVSGNIGGNIKPYPFGTRLNVTPTLLRTPDDDGGSRVHIKVEAGRTSILDLLVQSSADLSDTVAFDKVTVTSEAVIGVDDTLILSGLSQKERRTSQSGVPILRDIPGLNYLFSTRSEAEVDTSVIILLTPRDPAFTGDERRAALDRFVEMRRAFVAAKQGSEEDLRRFEARYPNWRDLPPNRFASHFHLLRTSETYRSLSGYDLTDEDLDLDILDSAWQ